VIASFTRRGFGVAATSDRVFGGAWPDVLQQRRDQTIGHVRWEIEVLRFDFLLPVFIVRVHAPEGSSRAAIVADRPLTS
jgi:hypothetical protein